MKKTAMICGIVLLLSMFFLMPVQAKNVRNETIEIDPGDIPIVFSVNPCNLEPILVTGRLHVVVNLKTTDNAVDLRIHANGQGVGGIGDFGNIYHGNAVVNHTQTINGPASFPLDIYPVMKINLVSKGSAPNAKIIVPLKLTVKSDYSMGVYVVPPFQYQCK
jgi:hypothetical protein